MEQALAHNRIWFPQQLPPPLDELAQLLCFGQSALEVGQIAELPQLGTEKSVLLVGIASGCLSVLLEDTAFRLHAGHLIALRGEDSYILTAEQTSSLTYAVLSGRAGELLYATLCEEKCFFYGGYVLLRRAIGSVFPKEAETQPAAAAAARAAYDLLLQLYGNAAPVVETAVYPPLVSEALQILQKDFIYLEGIEELARRLMVSEAHLVRAFRNAVGMTPGRYLTALRIDYAKALLHETDISVESVAQASGFSNASYFGKVFRRITRMTPAQYAATAAISPRRADYGIYL